MDRAVMPPKPLNFGPFIRGVHAETDPYTQPRGSVPRASNMIMTDRGALTPCDGSGIINFFGGAVQSGLGKISDEFLFSPTGVSSYYLAIAKVAVGLGIPRGISIASTTLMGALPAGTYYYKVTGIDGTGGETAASGEVGATLGAPGQITITWNVVPNAFAYNVYRASTSGTELILQLPGTLPVIQPSPLTLTVSFIDNGPATTNGVSISGATASTTSHGKLSIVYTTVTPFTVEPGVPVTISGMSPSSFNGTFTTANQISPTSFYVFGGPGSGTATGGTAVIGSSATPPVSDTTGQSALFRMPIGNIPVSYSDANIVAYFPQSLVGFGTVPTGGTGGGGSTGQGISGQAASTPSGGVVGLINQIPQMVQFTNRTVLALGNGFAPQIYSDASGTSVNPAFSGAITSISVSVDQVTITTSATLTAQNLPPGSNVILSMSDSTYSGVFVVISVNTGAGTFVVRNVATSGGASTGTFTVSTSPIVNTFVPNFPAWAASSQYAVNSVISPASPTPNHSCFKVIQAGATGATEPTWANFDNPGDTLSDGQATWQNLGPLASQAPSPPGVGHIIVYSGCLWVLNTYPSNTSSGIDGPCAMRMSDVDNPFSWNPVNSAFLDKDDGTEGMGLATFTISAEGIPPEGSLVAFKNYSGFQIIGIFGSSNFSIQRIRSDMGCFAPRSIWFAPGYGIMRYAHLGVAVFDGVTDTVVSEEMRPYLFPTNDYDVSDIVVADANWIPAAQGCLTVNPPMYVMAIPIGNSNGALTRILNYDLVLKCWGGPVDLPFSISSMTQVRPITSNPITVFGGYQDGTLQRWQAGDVEWYTGDSVAITPVVSSMQTPEAYGNPQDQKLHWRRLAIRGVSTGGNTTVTITPEVNGVAKPSRSYQIPPNGDFEIFAGFRLEGLRFNATITFTGHVEINRCDFQLYPKAIGVPSVCS